MISGLAAAAWYAAGRHGLGIALAGLSVVYHAVGYASGERLLKPRDRSAPPSIGTDSDGAVSLAAVLRKVTRSSPGIAQALIDGNAQGTESARTSCC